VPGVRGIREVLDLDLADAHPTSARAAVREFLLVRNVAGRSASSSARYTTLGFSSMEPTLW
jgi:hypothetical protein